jgi:Ca2+-binding EF-hand superfamily protein
MKSPALLLLVPILLGACATTPSSPLEKRFQQADANGDGIVSRAEFAELMVVEAFAIFDTNGDGVVDIHEFVEAGGMPANFRKINSSRSGKITLEEAKASRLIFERVVVPFDEADVNGNGAITYKEFVAYRQRLREAVR